MLYLPWYICLTNSCLLATAVTEQQTKFMWHCPWIMQNLFENQLFIQKTCWWYTTNQTCNLFVLLSENFAGSCLKVFKSYDNFSIPGVHNICIILYVYDMRDSSAVARGGEARFRKNKQPKPWGGCSHLVNNVAGPDENMKIGYSINNLCSYNMFYYLVFILQRQISWGSRKLLVNSGTATYKQEILMFSLNDHFRAFLVLSSLFLF